ncbi:hypothetical protein EON65_45440 [archaeon]|nr:MAG: hypothetical protein EON65_45440 [archaeon]
MKKELMEMGRTAQQVDRVMSTVGRALTSSSVEILKRRRDLLMTNEITRVRSNSVYFFWISYLLYVNVCMGCIGYIY